MASFDQIRHQFEEGGISRREFLRRAAVLGVSATVLAPILAACGGDEADVGDQELVLGFSLGTLAQRRWSFDRDFVEAAAKPLGMRVLVQSAEDDEGLQISQVENLLAQNINSLILSPVNVETAAPAVAAAKAANVPVVSYNSIVRNAEIDYWVSRDNFELGRVQAEPALAAVPSGRFVIVSGEPGSDIAQEVTQAIMEVLNPSIEAGAIELISQEYHRAWDPALGLAQVEQALSRTGNQLDAVLCNYDGFVLAILPALSQAGLLGKTWIGGNDVFLEVAQAIVEGNAHESGYTDLEDMASKAVAAAHALAQGRTPESDDTVDNGAGTIPGSRIRSFAVTNDNMCDFISTTGWLDPAEVYVNVPGGPPC